MPTVTQPAYTGGTQVKTNKFLVRPGDLALVQNVSSEILGSWKTRAGSTQEGTTLEASKPILGLHGLSQADGTSKHLAVVNNADDTQAVLKYNNAGTWTNITGATSLPASVLAYLVNYLDKAWLFGKTAAQSFITTGNLDGTTYTTESSFPKAAYAEEYGAKLYLIDVEIDGTRYPSTVAIGSIPVAGAITFDTVNDTFEVATDDGDFLTGGRKSYGRLMLFKQNSLHSWDKSSLVQVENKGATSPRSIASLDNNLIYFHFSAKRKGFYMWDGSSSKKISRAIEPIIKGMDRSLITKVAAGIIDDQYFAYLGDITLDSDIAEYYHLPPTLQNVLVEYNYDDNQWIIHTLPFNVTVFADFNNKLYLGDDTGKVYEFLAGASDAGTAITGKIITHGFYGQSPQEYSVRKTFDEISIFMHKAGGVKAFYSIDQGDWKELPALEALVNTFTISERGYGIRVMLVGSSPDFIFEGTEFKYSGYSSALRGEK